MIGKKRFALFLKEIANRGGEISINCGSKNCSASQVETKVLNCIDAQRDPHGLKQLYLFHVEGWRYYNKNYGNRFVSLSYLCGVDDNGTWAVRVPGTKKTVESALEWCVPSPVQRAYRRKQKVLRQGDVYAVERLKDNIYNLPKTHQWESKTRTLTHEQHTTLHVPFKTQFFIQYRLETSR